MHEGTRHEKENITYTGFVAQEVEKASNEINYDFSGVDVPKSEEDYYGLRYSQFVVPLVKAVQELSDMNDAKDARIDELQKQVDEIKGMLQASNKVSKAAISGAWISQNIPNPFVNTTYIGYSLPEKFRTAEISISDNTGKVIKHEKIVGGRNGRVHLNSTGLSSGTYNYSLFVDGNLISTKQMLLAK
jgi:hypothetical protein